MLEVLLREDDVVDNAYDVVLLLVVLVIAAEANVGKEMMDRGGGGGAILVTLKVVLLPALIDEARVAVKFPARVSLGVLAMAVSEATVVLDVHDAFTLGLPVVDSGGLTPLPGPLIRVVFANKLPEADAAEVTRTVMVMLEKLSVTLLGTGVEVMIKEPVTVPVTGTKDALPVNRGPPLDCCKGTKLPLPGDMISVVIAVGSAVLLVAAGVAVIDCTGTVNVPFGKTSVDISSPDWDSMDVTISSPLEVVALS